MKTLKLFNSVISKPTKGTKPFFISEEGFIIEANAVWAISQITRYYEKEKLSGNDLNKTFHKSWSKIKHSTRYELFREQIRHYLSTYGSNFQSEIYIPDEVIDVPGLKLKFKIIKAYTPEEMTHKCLSLLKSGIALKEETVDDLITVLADELNYTFTGKEGIKNKEAIVKIAEDYQVYPNMPVEFFRYIIYRTTNSTLLIKSPELIKAIKGSSYNPVRAFENFGLIKISEIFNRFKPLFLAYKSRCPKTINKISKLSKKYHKPLISNPLNTATQKILTKKDTKWLDNASPFALFKALNACYLRKNKQKSFVYRIRNGKGWVQENQIKRSINKKNYTFLLMYIKEKYSHRFTGVKIYLPKNVKYALPTSEKMFVGNIPTGTKFYGRRLAIGVYWKNSGGARDLDISGINIEGKTGWNGEYSQANGGLMYSGDITNAPDGAVEYLYANKNLIHDTLINNNVYNGTADCEYKIIIGKGSNITKDYMMNPNNLFAEIQCKSVQQQTILGILLPEKNKQCFVLLNFGMGHTRVSGNSKISKIATKALYQQWNKPISFNKVIKMLGAEIVPTPEEAHFDFSLDNIEKDSFIKLLIP